MAKLKPAGSHYPYSRLITFFLPILLCLLITGNAAVASPEAVKWTRVNIPAEGSAGNWVLAGGSDIQHLTMAADGTLYAYASGLTYTLYKSTDGGYGWAHIGKVQDNIVGIAISPEDTSYICYATTSAVYLSTDGGNTFSSLAANPGGAGSNNVEITSIDIAWLDSHIITIGTRDTDNGQFGGVYTLDTDHIVSTWTNTNIGSYDVYAVASSPEFPAYRQLVAVVTDETNTLVITKIGDAAWGASVGNAVLDKDNSGIPTPVVVSDSAAIAFPDDYDSDATSESYVQFIAIDTGAGNGDVYRIKGAEAPVESEATDLNTGGDYGLSNIDVTGLAVNGNSATASILAGAAGSAQTYFSSDGGTSWIKSRKEPTGTSDTYVLLANDFGSSGKAYCATSGGESAFSMSMESRTTWNQVGLIDTTVSSIIDLAPSPGYSQDETLFMLTFGGEHSLWRSLDGAGTWERVLCSTLPGVDSMALVQLSPQYGSDSQVVFLAGSSSGSPTVWKSADGGQSFIRYHTFDPDTGNTISIDTWEVFNDNELFIGSYDGSNGLVYNSTSGGFMYSTGTICGSQLLNSIVLSPNYEQDGTILIGNTNGWVYWSNDGGSSFEPLPLYATSPPLTGSVTVAYDPDFNNNKIIYAASSTADKGVYRFTIGTSTEWEQIDSNLPAGGLLCQVTVSANGTLYAANSISDDGMERCLNPTYSLGPTFETVTRGLTDGATLSGLWLSENNLWSIDTTNTKLMTFNECLTSPVTLLLPADETQGAGSVTNHSITNVSLDWEAWSGATSYEWQLDYDSNFSAVPSGFEGTLSATSVRLPSLEPATTYYWRVRASAPVLSPWSVKYTFTTSLETEPVNLNLNQPETGAGNVSISPLFQWSAVTGADAYELLVSTDVNFASTAIVKAGDYSLPSTAWQCNVNLNHDILYYWKVRATGANTHSAWSAVSAFTTESAPPPEKVPLPQVAPPLMLSPQPQLPDASLLTMPTPAGFKAQTSSPPLVAPLPPPAPEPAPPAPTTQEWAMYLITALFFVILLLITVILVMAVRIRNG